MVVAARADGVEGVVDALRIELGDRLAHVVRRAGAGRAERERLPATRLDRIDDEDLGRAGDPRALDDELADAARADHERREAGLGTRRVQHRADARSARRSRAAPPPPAARRRRAASPPPASTTTRSASAPVAVPRKTVSPSSESPVRPSRSVPRPIAEDNGPHAAGRPRRQARTRRTRSPGEDDAVALPQRRPTSDADRLDDPGALVAEHDRRGPVPLALVGVEVRAADADGAHPDDDLPGQRLLDVELLDARARPARA